MKDDQVISVVGFTAVVVAVLVGLLSIRNTIKRSLDDGVARVDQSIDALPGELVKALDGWMGRFR